MPRKRSNWPWVLGAGAFGALVLLFARGASASTQKKKDRGPTPAERIAGLGPGYAEPPEDVILLKEILGAWGYDPGPLTGNWTVQTSNALKAFQKDQGIETTGWVDNETPNRLASREQLLQHHRQAVGGLF